MGNQSNAARIRSATIGLTAASVIGTVALGGLAWAQDNADETATPTTTTTTSTTADDIRSGSSSSSTATWPQVTSGSSSSSQTRSSGS